MGQLAEKGYVMHIVENKLSIFDKKGSLILKSFLSKNRMFPVDIHMGGDFKCLNAIVNNESWLWHLRFVRNISLAHKFKIMFGLI